MLGKKFKKAISFVCAMAVALTCLATGVFAADPITKDAKIEFFTASPENVEPGYTVTLSWRVLAAKDVYITGAEKDLECKLEDSAEFWPLVTTEYTLHAIGFNNKEITKKVTVKVGEAEIKSFNASSYSIAPGENVTIAWDTFNTESVAIKELNKSGLQPKGSLVVNPTVTTTYTLIAKGGNGKEISKQITINVKAPEIISFKANKTEIELGDTVELSWEIRYAKDFKIVGIEREPNFVDKIEVWPTADTTYILTVEGFDGKQITKEVFVKVNDKKMITNFAASKTKITKGEMITLTWATKNAKACVIETNYGQTLKNMKLNGSIAVTPNKDITFTLIATDEKGKQEKKSIDIDVTN